MNARDLFFRFRKAIQAINHYCNEPEDNGRFFQRQEVRLAIFVITLFGLSSLCGFLNVLAFQAGIYYAFPVLLIFLQLTIWLVTKKNKSNKKL